ncbi:MAG: S-layer protein domain-containing protein, partial [Candidatus Methanoperedens sp.]|nr:S-layer protein domain-containing protein [Candidatus Methanoperedens sp.]
DKVIAQNGTYVYVEKSFAGETDVPLFVTYIDSVFAGATSDMVQLRYTWAISKSVTEVKTSDKYGSLEVATANASAIQLYNKDKTITLSRDGIIDVMGDIKFRVADNAILRYYPMVLRTAPGTYEVRGTVASGAVATSWDATSFAGFWYDLKDDLKTETLVENAALSSASAGADIGQNSLWYNTTNATKTLKVMQNNKANTDVTTAFGANALYNIVGWQAQPFVAIKDKVNKLSKLIIEQGNATAEKKSLTIGETWDVGDGWTVTAQSIDAKASPRQVWLVLSKDGVKLDDKVIAQNGTYVYVEKSFAGETDVPLFVTYVDSVFAGATSDMVQLRYTWAISKSVTEVKTSDKFGSLEVATANASAIQLYNKDKTITLTRDGKIDVMGEIKFRVADNAALRYYPMVEYQITGLKPGETPVVTPPGGTPVVTPKVNATVKPTNVTATPVMTEVTPAKTATPTPVPTPKEPGFEAVFAIAGLLAVAYLVLRQKK